MPMKSIDLKRQELIRFILQVKDESILDKVKNFFIPATKDWWNELSEETKLEIEMGLIDSEQGKTLPHDQVLKKIENLINARR